LYGRVVIADRMATRLLRLPQPRTGAGRREERIPMRDGAVLLAEHHVPATDYPLGTVLVRTPYGRRSALDAIGSRVLAVRGYHVLVQSVRGTFGSGGVFDPMVNEERDGHDTVAWLREQPWFDGRLATYGASYLGWTQWALMTDPPPELRAAVVLVAPHDFAASVYSSGAFAFQGFLAWSDLILHQETTGLLATIVRGATAKRRLASAHNGLPPADAVDTLLGGRAPWFRPWLAHPDLADPFWDDKRATAALTRSTVPTLLVGGWQDLFLEQTVAQYRALAERGVDVGLTVGPWTHLAVGTRGAATVARETLAWLDEHLAGATGRTRRAPVRAARTGDGHWFELATWPPPTVPRRWRLESAGRLTDLLDVADTSGLDETDPGARPPADAPTRDGDAGTPGGGRAAPTSGTGAGHVLAEFRYDPADPTPAVGGRLLTPDAGVRDNRRLAARPDVLTFATPPLEKELIIAGAARVELEHVADPPHADVFVRLCDIAPNGRAHNIADGMRRREPAAGPLAVELDPCFHRLAPGHRLALLVGGGAHPRFLRNNGTGEPPADATGLVPVIHRIGGGTLTVPLTEDHKLFPPAA
jgi:putative CocE/NonD family hydrolase